MTAHSIDPDALPYSPDKLPRKDEAGEFLVLGSLDPNGTVRLLRLEDSVEPGAPIA